MLGEKISHYRVLERVGEGGMGVVYKAEDTRLKRTVALKFLPKDLTRNQEARERFKLEAQAAAALNNPNIVTIHEIDEYAGHIYIVMEYVAGETLGSKIGHDREEDVTPLETPDPAKTDKIVHEFEGAAKPAAAVSIEIKNVIDIAIQVCKGLKSAHKLGIVHRDIKPQNIIINKEGVVKILDFGVAKLTRSTKETKGFATMGTIHYMSPDQLSGKGVDQRTDIWSLGVVMYETLTKKLPFFSDSAQAIMYSIVNEDPVPPSDLNDDIPAGLERIILKCLRKDPVGRYQSVEPLLADLKKIMKTLQKDSREIKLEKKKGARKESERRNATVVSVEITGHDEMMERMDAEEIAAAVSVYFDMLAAAAGKYEGRIDKMSGSSFMVYFGVPSAVENGPVRAVYSALEMRSQLELYNREGKFAVPLGIRIGISTGLVITGVMGEAGEKFSVIGDTVNLANQLRDTAAEGQIFVAPVTRKSTRSEFEYKEFKPTALKGKKKTAVIYEVLSAKEKTGRSPMTSERVVFSEMVGRGKEMDKLELHLLQVLNGEGFIINVIGEAGIGKSRLVAEFRKKDAFKRVTIFQGRALSIGKNLRFFPLIGAIKSWAGIDEKDSAPDSFDKLERAVKNIYPGGADEVFPFIATIMGMKLTGSYARQVEGLEGDALEKLIKKNFRDLVRAAAEKNPLVFIIEDLHWADMSSIELLESLFRIVINSPVLFINIFRPGYRETGEQLLATIEERYANFHLEIYLESLADDQAKLLISSLLKVKGLPENVIELITKRAGGNPFFIEEVMRSFIDDGVVERREGHFIVTEKIDYVVIPETINDVVMGRIDKLEEETRSLLKVASVIGRSFFYKILAAVAGDIEDIDDKLEFLKEVQLIRERRRMAELEYLFKHALVQEAAYESILIKKRKELHGKVAAAIESVFSERLREFYGMLALHYSLGEDIEKAETYLIKAGEEALKVAASSEALHYYREALKLYLKQHGDAGDPRTIANLEKNIATALYNRGMMTEAVLHCDRALKLWGEKLLKNKILVILKLIKDFLVLLKSLYFPGKKAKKEPGPEADAVFDIILKRGTALATYDNFRLFVNSMDILAKLNKLDLTKIPRGAPMYIQGSILFSFMGRFGISKKLLEYPREYINSGTPKAVFDYKYGQLMHGFLSGDWSEKLDHGEGVIDICLRQEDHFPVIVYLLWRGIFLLERGDFRGSQKCSEKLQEVGEAYKNDHPLTVVHLVSSRRLMKWRKLTEALSSTETGFSLASGITQKLLMRLNFLGVKANIQVLQGDTAAAERTLQQAEEIIAGEKMITPWPLSSYRLSRFLCDIKQLEKSVLKGDKTGIKEYRKKARQSGKAALEHTKRYAANRMEVYRLQGVYYWLTGKPGKALHWFGKSAAAGEKMGARTELARTYREIGERLSEKQGRFQQLNNIEAEEYLEKARKLYPEVGLEWESG